MGIVHHANYLHFFENARVLWLEEHDRPYRWYLEEGLHFAVTRVEIDYRSPARFGDELSVATWPGWVRGASLAMRYRITLGEETKVIGLTEHAAVDDHGRVRRIPRERREALAQLASRTP